MRVRHLVLTRSFAGVERHVCVLANAQAGMGHDVEVWGGDQASMRARLDPRVCRLPAERTLPTAMRALGGRAPDVLHAHMTRAEASTILVGLLRKVPVLATRHFAAPRGHGHAGALTRVTVGKAPDAQISISRYVADRIDGPSTVVYPGVESTQALSVVREQSILVVQRLQPEKATDIALRAFATGAPSDWVLQIIGEGPERPHLASLARGLGVEDRVRFLGFRNDVEEFMARGSVIIAPCEIEGFGLSVVEAMSHGVPVVASRSGAHPETVGLSPDAHLFSPGDVEEAALMIERLCASPDLRQRYGQDLARIQRSHFEPSVQARATDAVYAEVLG